MSGPPPDSDPTPEPEAPTPGASPDEWDSWADLPLEGEERARAPLFLGREIYRRRRVMDAARLLPAFGTALLLLPMLWAKGHGTAAGAVYTFIVWFLLIAAAAFLAHRLAEPLRESQKQLDPGSEDS